MASINQQITSDIKLLQKKLRSVGKMPARYLLGLGVLGVVTIGMLVGLVASRQTTEDRSQATGGGPKFYLTKPADPMNITSVVLPRETDPPTFTPVTDIQVMATAGRPVTSFSFVARLTNGAGDRLSVEQADRTWEQFEFTFNPKVSATDTIQEKLYQVGSPADMVGAKLFAGTIGQQVATVQNTVWDPVRLGSFTFTPVANQPDVQLHLIPVAGRPEANSLYLKGSLINSADGEEQIAPENLIGPFTIRNPFYVDPNAPPATATPTPGVNGDIGVVPIMQLVNDRWQSLPTTFDFTDFAGTELLPKYLRTEISQANVFSPWWRESTSVGFRMRVRMANGNYRAVIPLEGQINPNTTELVQWMPDGSYSGGTGKLFAKWKVVSQGDNVYIEIPTTLTTGVANLANPGQRLLFEPGDTLEVRANVHMQNYPNPGVSRTCKVDGTIVEAPIGNPTSQVEIGPCRNNSAFRVVWASADATPSVTPSSTPTLTPTSTPGQNTPADLVPTFFDTPTSVSVNQSFPVNIRVSNVGGTMTPNPVTVILYRNDVEIYRTTRQATVSPNESYTITRNEVSATAGTLNYRARVIMSGEYLTSNNIATTSVVVSTTPPSSTPTLTPTPTSSENPATFSCPVFSIDPTLTWPMPIAPYDITSRELTVFTFDSTAPPAVRRWARIVHDSTNQVACNSSFFELRYVPASFSNRVIGKLGLPDPVTGIQSRCGLQAGIYRLQVMYELSDGTTKACRSSNSLTVQPDPG